MTDALAAATEALDEFDRLERVKERLLAMTPEEQLEVFELGLKARDERDSKGDE